MIFNFNFLEQHHNLAGGTNGYS